MPNLEHPNSPFWVQGRYFGHKDPRHEKHKLSKAIWRFKQHHHSLTNTFAEIFLDGIDTALQHNASLPSVNLNAAPNHFFEVARSTETAPRLSVPIYFDYVTQVPSRPEVGDRLKLCLHAMKQQLVQTAPTLDNNSSSGFTLDSKTHVSDINQASMSQIASMQIRPDVLRCVKDYRGVKTLSAQSRKAAVANAFRVQSNVKGKHVAIIDDIVTTGATMDECVKTLMNAGATSVTPLLIAYHPYALRLGVINHK